MTDPDKEPPFIDLHPSQWERIEHRQPFWGENGKFFLIMFLLFAAALAYAAIPAPAKAQSAEGSKVDFDNGTLLYYDADCDGPHECTFAMVGCEYETPSISFSMDQKDVSAWFAKSNGRVWLKVGQVSIETIPSEIEHSDLDDDWWPSISPGNESETLWGLLRPGQTLEIVAGPKQLNLLHLSDDGDLRRHHRGVGIEVPLQSAAPERGGCDTDNCAARAPKPLLSI
jgi:hypothetical protein